MATQEVEINMELLTNEIRMIEELLDKLKKDVATLKLSIPKQTVREDKKEETNDPQDVKPYRCEVCGVGFGYPHTLRRHTRSSCKGNKA